jgi:hypothetical protein
MFKDIKPLSKSEFTDIKYDKISIFEILKHTKYIPLCLDEVLALNSLAPIFIISINNKDKEFMTMAGLGPNNTLYHHNRDMYIPRVFRMYPFCMMSIKDKNNELVDIIAIDDNKEFVSKNKTNPIFTKDNELTKETQRRVEDTKIVFANRDLNRNFVKELEECDLLIKQEFNIKYKDEIINVIPEFWIINKDKLNNLKSDILEKWNKNNNLGIINAHLYSLRNFTKISQL